tara:strand:- start:40209 stop:40397 length:189 start_codon:yes stop_codon:yes gene_type:complete
MIIATIKNWQLYELKSEPRKRLRVAYNTDQWTFHLVCDAEETIWDPDPMIPQDVIEAHLETL